MSTLRCEERDGLWPDWHSSLSSFHGIDSVWRPGIRQDISQHHPTPLMLLPINTPLDVYCKVWNLLNLTYFSSLPARKDQVEVSYMYTHTVLCHYTSIRILWECCVYTDSTVTCVMANSSWQANNYNVEICSTATQTDNDITSDGMLLKLLSKKLVFEDLQHFRAPSVEEYWGGMDHCSSHIKYEKFYGFLFTHRM